MNTFLLKLSMVLFVACIPLLVRRDKETDTLGNPALRFYGLSLMLLVVGVFFLYLIALGEPSVNSKEYRDSVYVYYFFLAISLALSFLAFRLRIVLVNDEILLLTGILPERHYPLYSIIAVTMEKYTAIKFSGGRNIVVFPTTSGRRYFFQKLEERLAAISSH